jgi:peptidoglycan/LPS O-acetylase OafA/YrhL
MNLIRSLILISFGGLLLLLTVRRLSQYKLKERYALIFLFTGLPFLALAFLPDAMGKLAAWIHIDYRTLMLLGISAFLLLMVFELLSIVSQQDRKITTLAQMVGILMEKQQKELQTSVKPDQN